MLVDPYVTPPRPTPVSGACAGVCAGDLRSTSGMRIEWVGEDAAPILRMARAPLDGRDQGADRGVLRGHLNQGLPPVHELREGRPSGSSPPSSRRSFSTLFRGSPRGEEFRPLALVFIRGMVEVEIGVARTASIKSSRSATVIIPEWFTFKEVISDLQFRVGRKSGPLSISRRP